MQHCMLAIHVSFQLSKFRFASVSTFKGKKYVNIREYYEQDGELKPGRKGNLFVPVVSLPISPADISP